MPSHKCISLTNRCAHMLAHMWAHLLPTSRSTCAFNLCTILELFSWDRTGITIALEGSLCYFNEGTSPIVYSPILRLLLVVLNGFNAWKWWIRYPAATYMNTFRYPLNLVGRQGHRSLHIPRHWWQLWTLPVIICQLYREDLFDLYMFLCS